jgi:hypothetical protein
MEARAMSYRVEVRQSVQRKILSWSLPDPVLVEVHLRLRDERLTHDPWRSLVRTRQPFDGMTYYFSMIDPDNRFCEHFFFFLVQYSQNEETLIVANAGYVRHSGV